MNGTAWRTRFEARVQAQESLRTNSRVSAWLADPPALMEDCGFVPDNWQRNLLLSQSSRILLLCARQSGKSTATAALTIHRAITEPNSLCLMVSPSLRQSGEIFRKVVKFWRDLGRPVIATQETALTLTLINGSRVVSLPGEAMTVRGYSSPSLIVIDEAAMTRDELFVALNPMLAVSPNGRLICLSTPLGQRGWFYSTWTGEPGPWERIRVTAPDCPRISEEFLEEQRQSLGERWYAQEYLCSFEETIGQLISNELISRAFDNDLQLMFPER